MNSEDDANITDDAPAPVSPSDSESKEEAGADRRGTPREIGGRTGPDPTRYGDWEKNGRCIDF